MACRAGRAHRVHVCAGPCADPELRAEHADLKRKLARKHGGNRNAYTNAKAGFVARVVSAAGIELPTRDRLPE